MGVMCVFAFLIGRDGGCYLFGVSFCMATSLKLASLSAVVPSSSGRDLRGSVLSKSPGG